MYTRTRKEGWGGKELPLTCKSIHIWVTNSSDPLLFPPLPSPLIFLCVYSCCLRLGYFFTPAVPVEAADLVALTQPWEASGGGGGGGKRELLLVSPTGLARHWPDLHSPRRYTDVDARSVAPKQSVSW